MTLTTDAWGTPTGYGDSAFQPTVNYGAFSLPSDSTFAAIYPASSTFSSLPSVPAYKPPAATAIQPTNPYPTNPYPSNVAVNPVTSTATQLGQMANALRQQTTGQNLALRDAILAGYDQRIADNRELSGGVNSLTAQATADAAATRAKNDAAVEQYGESMRQQLDRQRQQQMASATNSAMSRGLYNTSILDSLKRGVQSNFDQQNLNLNDILLQNRITTDSNLSAQYQNALRAQAQNQMALNSTENSLTGDRLEFLGGTQMQGPSFADVANYYLQAAAAVPPAPAPTATYTPFDSLSTLQNANQMSDIKNYYDYFYNQNQQANAPYFAQLKAYNNYLGTKIPL